MKSVVYILLVTSLFLTPMATTQNTGIDTISVTSSEITIDDYYVKVLTYNIYQSGANPEFMDVLKEENADVLLLVETGDWDDNNNNSLREYTEELNEYFDDELPYKAYTDQKADFPTTGNAILSRFNMTDITEVFELTLDDDAYWYATHDLVVATLDVFGMEIAVASTHLKCCTGDFNEERREKEQEGFNNYFDTLGNDTPLIYGGDLNAYAPGEGTALGTEPVAMLTNASHPKASTNHTFVDSFRELNPDQDGDTFYSGGRIDYIFVNQHLDRYMMNSTVGDTPSADGASDHYSVDLFLNMTHLAPIPQTTQSSSTTTTTNSTITTSSTIGKNTTSEISLSSTDEVPIYFHIIPIFVLLVPLRRYFNKQAQ